MDASGLIATPHSVNFITLTLAQLNSDIKVTAYTDADHVLVVNVVGNGQPFHMASTFNPKVDPAFSMLNFTNIPSIYFDQQGSNNKFSILAPDTHGYLDSKEQHGQLVFENLNQTDKNYIHPHLFMGEIFWGE